MAIPTPTTPTNTEPTDLPRFASTDVANGPGGANNVEEPSESKKDIGWQVGERPPRETMNWIHRMTYQWTAYLDSWIDYVRNALPPVADNWAIDPATTTGLTFGLKAGAVRITSDPGSHSVEGTAATTVSLTNNATNIVFYNGTANAVQVTTSYSNAQDKIPLFQIVTSGGAIVWASSLDLRTPHSLFIPHTFSGAGDPGYVPDPVSESSRVLIDTGAWAVAQSLIAVFAGAGGDGLVPDPGSESGLFLRDDGTWAAPAVSGYHGTVNADGTTGAGGFTTSFGGGVFTVNHGLGHTNYVIQLTAYYDGAANTDDAFGAHIVSKGTNTFTYRTYRSEDSTTTTASLTKTDYSIFLI